jgi:hypothetical protein
MIRGMHVYLPYIYTAAIMASFGSAMAINHFHNMNRILYGLGGTDGYSTMDYGLIQRARKNNHRAKAIKRNRHG